MMVMTVMTPDAPRWRAKCKVGAMTRCPTCGAEVFRITTPLGEVVLLDPAPVEGCYTLNQCQPGLGMAFPASVLRRVHKCEVTK